MALRIYGVALSRAGRTLWMAEELGLPYEHVKTTFTGGTRTPEYLKINPNGHIPAIDEDGFTLWESMAINLYLAKKHGAGRLYPTRLEDEARAFPNAVSNRANSLLYVRNRPREMRDPEAPLMS